MTRYDLGKTGEIRGSHKKNASRLQGVEAAQAITDGLLREAARQNEPEKKRAPKRGPQGRGGIRKHPYVKVGWTEDPGRQGLGGWVKLPVEN